MDKLSGRTAHRPQFQLMLKHLRPGDTVIVYAFSRLFRNSQQLIELFTRFNAEKITLRSLTEHIDIRTSHGRMAAKILAAVDEAEVERLAERTKDGMAERKRQGAVFGRPRIVDPEDIQKMRAMRKSKVPVATIASRFHCSAATVYNNT
jgi:DNA invertase Pin-like site-specific DNA recombinase